MALYQPQPPQPFIGGNQPLAPREFTPPSGAVVAEKPPRRILPETVLAAWRVELWPQQQYRKLVQEAVAAAAVNPPFDQAWLFSILSQWQITAPVIQARQLSPGIPGQSADKPPNRAIDLRAALISWQPPQPQQIQYARYIQAVAAQAVDNPPFGLRGYLNTLSQWQARPLTPIISGWQIQEFIPADNPPFGMPQDWLWGALGQWQITPQAQTQYRKLVQAAIAAAADNPPFGMPQDWLWGTFSQWQITTPALIRYPKLAQAFIAAVDQPPPRSTLNFITTLKAWEPAVIQPQHNIYLPQPFVVVPVDNPPFGMPPDWLYSVLTATWKPGEPLPKVLQKILQEGAAPVIATGQKEKRKWRRSSS